jgi:DNA mismatch repair protein MutS2
MGWARYGEESGDPTIDLHGLRVADALRRVDAFLRQHRSAGAVCVRVVTGNGTGAIKEAVRELLSRHPAVATWSPTLRRDAATIVTLKPPGKG